jgi:transposase-like protein
VATLIDNGEVWNKGQTKNKQMKTTASKVRTQQRKPVCLSCMSFDVEAVVDGEPAKLQLFACFDCQDVLYFMLNARPRARRLGLFELY